MAEIIRMPRLSDTMEEGNIVEWHKSVGDEIEPGDVLAEVETDKATMEVESYQEGTLLHIGVKEGPVPVNALIAVIGEEGEDYEELLEAEEENISNSEKSEDTEDTTEPAASQSNENVEQNVASPETPSTTQESKGRIKASPLAKAMASEKGINLSAVNGTGDGGRIIKRDIENYSPSTRKVIPGGHEDIPVNQMRKTIARRLAESKFSAPHFYLTMEINMDKAIEVRKNINESMEEGKVSFNDLIIKAAAAALGKHPAVNSSWMGDVIRRNHDINIGVAVAIEEGLMVPVLRHSDQLSISEVSSEVKALAEKARNRTLQSEEMSGNTFTISNLGMFGIEEFTAIINPPDSCILAVGGIKQTPVLADGELRNTSVMKVTLSCDHRVVDGVKGSEFLQTLQSHLENPMRMFI